MFMGGASGDDISSSGSGLGSVLLDYGVLTNSDWHGPVRVQEVLVRLGQNAEALEAGIAKLESYFTTVQKSAKTRCIDGRIDPNSDSADLGPQVPGGAAGAAIAYRLGVDSDDLTRGSYVADAEAMIDTFLRFGMNPGGHRDEHADEHTAGCGAIDKMDVMIKKMVDPAHVEDHKRIVKILLGNSFNRSRYLQVLGAATLINAHSEEYFRNRDDIIDYLEKKTSGSVTTLKGQHNECIVIVNLVPNTTLDSLRFSNENHDIQAFGYDMWRSAQIASRILGRPDQTEEREKFFMARVMCSVATLMAITDGSQRFILRMPTTS